MFRYLLLALGLVALGGCAFAQDVMRSIEPLLDAGAKMAADSAGMAAEEAIKKHMGGGPVPWSGGEIATATGGIVMTAYGALKAALYAWNRKPKDE